jgi:hypothetical protein
VLVNLCISWDQLIPTLGLILLSMCPNLFGALIFVIHLMLDQAPWHVRLPKVPTCTTSATLGCWRNPKFHFLRTWVRVPMPFLMSNLHPPPPQVISILEKIYKICYIQVFTRTCILIATKSAGDHKFRANWKPQIYIKVETPSFHMKWETQVSNSHYNHPHFPIPKVVCDQIFRYIGKTSLPKLCFQCPRFHCPIVTITIRFVATAASIVAATSIKTPKMSKC